MSQNNISNNGITINKGDQINSSGTYNKIEGDATIHNYIGRDSHNNLEIMCEVKKSKFAIGALVSSAIAIVGEVVGLLRVIDGVIKAQTDIGVKAGDGLSTLVLLMLWVVVVIICFIVLWGVAISVKELIFRKKFNSLIRRGLKVYKIIPPKCLMCGKKVGRRRMELYKENEKYYFRCRNNRNHKVEYDPTRTSVDI